ncbi:MAG: polyamine aminopropyltransferase [Armatimonadetes bacterium]|nr:polyamine aminopropyltransferase [Armatimonadota bacterium]MDW8154861.1 polyamine aminopropyltransferase [Armatimonadota bacterium]
MEEWFRDTGGEGFANAYRIDEVLFDGRSRYQHVQVVRNAFFGRMLLLDEAVQTTEADEFIYHEMLAHLPLVTHPAPASLLIIGGGDGGLLEEALKHPLRRAVMVEIDELVVEVTRRYIPEIPRGAFEDPRVELRFEDGFVYVRRTEGRFDVVLVDSTDPQGPSVPLFSSEFYGDLQRLLTEEGVVAVQSGSPLYQRDLIVQVRRNLKQHFPIVRTFLVPIPTYPGALWSFTLGSKGPDPLAISPGVIEDRIAGMNLQYYTAARHHESLIAPPFLREVLEA